MSILDYFNMFNNAIKKIIDFQKMLQNVGYIWYIVKFVKYLLNITINLFLINSG